MITAQKLLLWGIAFLITPVTFVIMYVANTIIRNRFFSLYYFSQEYPPHCLQPVENCRTITTVVDNLPAFIPFLTGLTACCLISFLFYYLFVAHLKYTLVISRFIILNCILVVGFSLVLVIAQFVIIHYFFSFTSFIMLFALLTELLIVSGSYLGLSLVMVRLSRRISS
jgi:hypothetical protein